METPEALDTILDELGLRNEKHPHCHLNDVVERYQPFQLDPAMRIPFCVMDHVLSNKSLAEEIDSQRDTATRSDSLVRNDSSTCCIVLSSILWLEEFSIADYDILQALQNAATADKERSCLDWPFDGFMGPQILRGRKLQKKSTRY